MAPVSSPRSPLARQLTIAITIPVALLVVLGAILGRQILAMSEDARWVDHSDLALATANETIRQVIDQETGFRGYLITEDPAFLDPFERAHPAQGFERLHALVTDNPAQQARFDGAQQRYQRWLEGVTRVLDQHTLAEARVGDRMRERKLQMDGLREAMREAIEVEDGLRRGRVEASAQSTTATRVLFVSLVGAAALALAFLSRRQLSQIARTFGAALDAEKKAREATEAEGWIRSGQATVAAAVQGERTMTDLGVDALSALAALTGADIGAFFTREAGGWRRRAGYALDGRTAGAEAFAQGEGLVGRAGAEGALVHLRQVPVDYLKLVSGTGEASPAELVLLPAHLEGVTHAVLELGFLRPVEPRALELFRRIGESVALAVRSSEYKQQLRELLEESQRQAEELQTQQEELRVANEELEAQTTALRATQRQLETQQAELEQTNESLASQATTLERQNQQLADTKAEIAAKAREVERASQFKSEFLSNMSHELRTPLNSSLIMAKLLADNRDGNLSAEQIKFAETIYSAGNDLLTLINDILDLSKIEAGKMEVRPGPVALERLRGTLARTFEPIAADRGLRLSLTVAPSAPASIETDDQRVEQILRNLLSNALKFTERGQVALEITGEGEGDRVTFAVRDSGIGIPAGQQRIIFEAFRQADGTTNRKYGGTGLGLSISRELARLLGGDIAVSSEVGQGSVFTLSLPRVYAGPLAAAEPHAPAPQVPTPSAPPVSPRAEPPSAEAVDQVPEPGRRVVLVVEDDEVFAGILVDVAREAGFACLVATTGQQGFRLARKHVPTGIVLDMKLPDHSGLSVLDRLKRDPVTRHIPVHVMSASDHAETALAMGAAAYLLKPVAREQLVEALRALEIQSSHRVRRVLVVDDDAELRESVAALLGSAEVEISTAATAAEALELLRDRTFDCVVTDLGLPGQSGYELLETMATRAPYSVPPIIVYTGRALTPAEEQGLRRYSKSIIVKGARSPERLLDEVTLFLHQVESELPQDQQRLLRQARHREAVFEGRTVLVVEDDVRNVFALTSVIEPKGARVVIARNGKEALAALDKEPAIDLVLMDVMMPEMDGLEATRRIRQNPRWGRLPIIALTAKAMRDDQEKCLAAGANDYLAKPLDVEMLVSLLRVWMPAA